MKLYRIYLEQHSVAAAPPIAPEEFAQMVATGVELLIGVALFLGARGVVRLRHKLRGQTDEADPV